MRSHHRILQAITLLMLILPAAPAQAITNGFDGPDTADAQSTVVIKNLVGGDTATTTDDVLVNHCTGTLVAADLVLTAGHCVEHNGEAGPEPADYPHPAFRGSAHPDWERPDQFYPASLLGTPLVVTVAEDATFDQTDIRPGDFQANVIEFAVPGDADMALLRLDRAVGAQATRVPILTSLPVAAADVGNWISQTSLQAAGFSVPGGTWSLQSVNLGKATFPCKGQTRHKMCASVISPATAELEGGDSGGPVYIDPSGARKLIAVHQCCWNTQSPIETATFYRGGANTTDRRIDLPNLGGWLEQFVSRKNGGAAYVWSTGGRAVLDYGYASNPSGLRPRVERLRTGVYRVRFEGLRTSAGPRVALVAAMGTDRRCTVTYETDPSLFTVRCFARRLEEIEFYRWERVTRPADTDFQLLTDYGQRDLLMRIPRMTFGVRTIWTSHGYVAVTRLGTGRVRVDAPSYPDGGWRNVMVSAEGETAASCHPVTWSENSAEIRCDWAGSPIDSGFSLAATPGTDASYAVGFNPTASSYTASPRFSNTAGRSDIPTIQRWDAGTYRVTFPGLSTQPGGSVQVEALGNTGNHCNLNGFDASLVGVLCTDQFNVPRDTTFVVRYTDPTDVGRTVRIELDEIAGTSEDASGGLDLLGTMRFTAGASGSRSIPLVNDAKNRRFSPPLVLTARSQPGQQFVDVEMLINDDDGTHVDAVDIVPNQYVTKLRLRIDLVRHQVQMLDASTPVIGGLGTWWSDGLDGAETARVAFKVLISDH